LFLSSSKTWPSRVLSFVFIMTVVVPLSTFLISMSEFDLRSLIALRSSKSKLFRGFDSTISASLCLLFVETDKRTSVRSSFVGFVSVL